MKLKQKGLKLGLAMVAAGLLSLQAHAADGFDGAVEPMNAGPTTVTAYATGAHALVASVEQVSALPKAAPAFAPAAPAVQQAAGSGPLEVEGSAALAAFSQADIATLFEPSAAPLQLAALSEQEMKETEGAVIWFAPVVAWSVGGGVLGVGVNRWATGSWAGSGRAFGAGATAGFWSSNLAVRVARPAGAFALGAIGSASWIRR